jgi:hypothetical protein
LTRSLVRGQGFDRLSPNGNPPFALSLSGGLARRTQGFDKLRPNGNPPFALSLSKGPARHTQGFDKLARTATLRSP